MDFSYYNSKGEKVRLDLTVGAKWKDLNIKNQFLNSVFNSVDDGDGLISENEFSILEKLFKKADRLVETTADNKILEDEELEELVKKIENGSIKIPKSKERQWQVHVVHDLRLSRADIEKFHEDPEAFYSSMTEKVKSEMLKYFWQYPSEQYDMEVYPTERADRYKVFYYAKDNNVAQTLSSVSTVIRADGIELEMKDYYNDEIDNDANQNFNEIRQSAHFGTFTITGRDGQKHELNFRLDECYYSDILDCRLVKQQVSEFLAELPAEIINQLIENNVEDISFTSDYDDPFLADKDYYRNKMDENGNVFDIGEGYATIISPQFAIKEREYKDTFVERDDGYKFSIVDNSEVTSVLEVTSPSGNVFQIELESGIDRDFYHQWQIPKLASLVKNLSPQVLEDLSNEVSSIKFMDDNVDENGMYVLGTNSIAYRAGKEWPTPNISFVHELGHAIDNHNGTMYSHSPEFVAKFDKLKALLQKNNVELNHSTDSAEEFFASTYADKYYPQDKSDNNHIAEIQRQIEGFKESNNPDEAECFKLFEELKQEVLSFVDVARNQPKTSRADNTTRDIVRAECQDIIEEAKEYYYYLRNSFSAQSVELEMISVLEADDEHFNKSIKFYEVFAKNERVNFIGQKLETPPEIQQFFVKLIDRMQELRAGMKKD